MDDAVFRDWGPPVRVRVERTPVWAFARAVTDRSPVYASACAAHAAGFDDVPVPPTFTFAMVHSGAFPDLQPPDGRGSLMDISASGDAGFARRGLYLHGEQHFEYHRWPVVGDVLEGRMRVSEPYEKQGSRGTMELTILETRWTDAGGEPVVTERIVSVFVPS